MTRGYRLAHLGKHRGDKVETGGRQELRRVKRRKETRCGWNMGKRGIFCRIDVVMIAGLFEKIEEILTGNEFEKEEEKG